MLSHVAGPNNFLGQTEAKARYSLVQSLARIWLQQNRIHRSYLEELLELRGEGFGAHRLLQHTILFHMIPSAPRLHWQDPRRT